MPMYASGASETLTPFSLAGVIPPLTFVWSINSRQIAQLRSAFHRVCARIFIGNIVSVIVTVPLVQRVVVMDLR